VSKILLTGANGFLGAFMLDELLAKGYEVTIIKRPNSDLQRIHKHINKIKIFEIISYPLSKLFIETKFDIIIHLACCYGRNNETDIEIVDSNILFGLELIQQAINHNVNTFINASSFLVDRPLSGHELKPYILSKKQFSQWLNYYSNQIQVINLKIEHIFGPNDNQSKFVPWIISEIKSKKYPILLNQGEELRDFVHVSDVVGALLFLLNKKLPKKKYNNFNIGSGNYLKIEEFLGLAQKIHKELNSKHPTSPKLTKIRNQNQENRVNTRINALKELGWHPNCTIVEGIYDLFS
jgi:nucleoside-diphosphate-sugar epimerase